MYANVLLKEIKNKIVYLECYEREICNEIISVFVVLNVRACFIGKRGEKCLPAYSRCLIML